MLTVLWFGQWKVLDEQDTPGSSPPSVSLSPGEGWSAVTGTSQNAFWWTRQTEPDGPRSLWPQHALMKSPSQAECVTRVNVWVREEPSTSCWKLLPVDFGVLILCLNSSYLQFLPLSALTLHVCFMFYMCVILFVFEVYDCFFQYPFYLKTCYFLSYGLICFTSYVAWVCSGFLHSLSSFKSMDQDPIVGRKSLCNGHWEDLQILI